MKATRSAVNFLYMSNANEKGTKFADLSAARGVKARIARLLSVEPAVVNNWRTRGVPAMYANAVAHLLGCRPDEIGDVVPVPEMEPGSPIGPTAGAANPIVGRVMAPSVDPARIARDAYEEVLLLEWRRANEDQRRAALAALTAAPPPPPQRGADRFKKPLHEVVTEDMARGQAERAHEAEVERGQFKERRLRNVGPPGGVERRTEQ